MPRPRKAAAPAEQSDLFTLRLRTAPCVPSLRKATAEWRAAGYEGATATTKRLFQHWFYTDHRLTGRTEFKYFPFQREAVETLVYLWEVKKARRFKTLMESYAQGDPREDLRLLQYDLFPRYCVKMATGSGKTKVMALAAVWQFLNAARGEGADYAKTFLVIAPNVIVFDRLKLDFANGRIFRSDPMIPKDMEVHWDFDCCMRGDGEKGRSEGRLYLTNIHQLYEEDEENKPSDEPEPVAALLGRKPPSTMAQGSARDFVERIAKRGGPVAVLNDEAHHTHDEESEWNKVIRETLHPQAPVGVQLDFSATPRFQKGALFPWTVFDYPIKQAIQDGIVKRPLKGVATGIAEARSERASVRYAAYLAAGVERWREYREKLKPLRKKPVLFIMLSDTNEADDVGEWLQERFPSDFGGDKTLIIHTKNNGEIKDNDVDIARKLAREVDTDANRVNAIVSVLMLREGWDVQNVTVVVGLRPYTAKANILPEQAIGRGLRLMFRGQSPNGYKERVDIIGNQTFLDFVTDLDKIEDMVMETFEIGKDKLEIIVIEPKEDRKKFDFEIPELSPTLVRKKSLSEEITALDVMAFDCPMLPFKISDATKIKEDIVHYAGYDVLTMEKELEREYKVPQYQTPQEVIGYYARRIAEAVKLPSQFSVLAPKVREFFERRAFGKAVDLDAPGALQSMSTSTAHYVCVEAFKRALADTLALEQEPKLLAPGRPLSSMQAFPWSRIVYEARKCPLNLVPCANESERTFARFLDGAEDVARFCKLDDTPFGFAVDYLDSASNSRHYYPDFTALDTGGTYWLLEWKGRVDKDDIEKANAAVRWCENATALTGKTWRYILVEQKEFDKLRPQTLADLQVLARTLCS